MDWYEILLTFKGTIGGLLIAVATVIAVLINLRYNRHNEHRLKREQNATFSSAIAAELLDNAHNLMELYFQISLQKDKNSRITSYREFNLLAYQNLLTEIGRLGPALSFMIVDIYGDIQKIRKRLDTLSDEEIKEFHDDILPDIQLILVKAMTGSAVMSFYADYMLGHKWMASTTEQRILWLENTLDDFCEYVGRADDDFIFPSAEDPEGLSMIKRISDSHKRKLMTALFSLTRRVLTDIRHRKAWRVQLILRAFSFKMQNTLIDFLDIPPHTYFLRSEKEYQEFLPDVDESKASRP